MDNGNETTKKDRVTNFFTEKEHHKAEFVFLIIINLIFLYVANNIVSWNLSFIAPSFTEVLGILNLLLIVTIIINIIFIIYSAGWFKNLLEVITDILGLQTIWAFITVFPFILGDLLGLALMIFLVLCFIGGIVGLFIHIAKFVYGVFNR